MAADFYKVIEEHGRSLARVARLYSTAEGREDLLQDISLAIWKALPRFRGESSLRTFLFRIAHNRGIRFLAHQRARRPVGPVPESPDPRPGPEERAIHRQATRRLYAAVELLPLGQRQVLSLALEGLSHREIADVLGIRETNVAVRLHRARGALRSSLEGSDE